ncbi:nucleotidyltransferase domain-containing protein [Chengkuizengella marina]|uniref:Nucleotidyltransferase domain-containing protein n=1 Tax=Chengkuizengella marina TaxID=2507566 RepID=A0A6N9Q8A8_9BACL|nr:nucleotidyltransferase domain-containing protein [Chengkuizengella marina]NBI31098.1 nucleotidyltransferase domain-containing protein [Chengkuizengella marina]
MNLTPIEAATKFVELNFPNCSAAFLAASAKKGSIKKNSDLDIVIFDNEITLHFRKVYDYAPWPAEVFGFNLSSFKEFMNKNDSYALPTIYIIITKGFVVKDNGEAESIKKMCEERLIQGPPSWSFDELNFARFEITDQLEDLITSQHEMENYFIVNKLFTLCATFILRVNDLWLGDGKWLYRELTAYHKGVSEQFISAFESYYKTSDKQQLIDFIDSMLEPYGGRLFAGFYQEEEEEEEDMIE